MKVHSFLQVKRSLIKIGSRDVNVSCAVLQWWIWLWSYMSWKIYNIYYYNRMSQQIKSIWLWLKWQWDLSDYLAYMEIIYLKPWRCELHKWWYERHVWSCKALLHLKVSLASEDREEYGFLSYSDLLLIMYIAIWYNTIAIFFFERLFYCT